jgi:YesN/AraC family two-component response regulator
MKLHVKNMVSGRCIMIVEAELKKLDIVFSKVELGFCKVSKQLGKKQIDLLEERLATWDLHLMADKNEILVEKIKNIIMQMINTESDMPKKKFSEILSNQLGYDYTYLSNIFSNKLHISIQQFIIKHKIEKAKELLQSKEYSLTEVSYILQYSSVAHLSKQFKKITGSTVSGFLKNNMAGRLNLENV